MEPKGSLPYSKEPTTCPYPQPDQSSPCSPIPFLENPFQYFCPTYTKVFLFHSGVPTKLIYAPILSPIRATLSTNSMTSSVLTLNTHKYTIFYIYMPVQRNYNSKLQPTRCNVSWFIYFYRRSTCFRRFLRPSSGAHNCTYSYVLLTMGGGTAWNM